MTGGRTTLVVLKERAHQSRALELGALEQIVRQHGSTEIGAPKAGSPKIAVQYRDAREVRAVKVTAAEIGAMDLHLHHVCTAKVTTGHSGSAKCAPKQRGSREPAAYEDRIIKVDAVKVLV